MPGIAGQLEHTLRGPVAYIGIGNVDHGDDGFGVRLAEALATAGVAHVIVAGTVPENCLGCVAHKEFDHVVFLDAVEFGGGPGSAVFLDAKEIACCFPQISTHKIALGTLAKLIESGDRTRVWLLGVGPETLKGSSLSSTVAKTLAAFKEMICALPLAHAEIAAAEVKR